MLDDSADGEACRSCIIMTAPGETTRSSAAIATVKAADAATPSTTIVFLPLWPAMAAWIAEPS